MISIQEVIQTQERSISDLLKVVKEQSEHLNNQKNKIKSLENKVVLFVQLDHLYSEWSFYNKYNTTLSIAL